MDNLTKLIYEQILEAMVHQSSSEDTLDESRGREEAEKAFGKGSKAAQAFMKDYKARFTAMSDSPNVAYAAKRKAGHVPDVEGKAYTDSTGKRKLTQTGFAALRRMRAAKVGQVTPLKAGMRKTKKSLQKQEKDLEELYAQFVSEYEAVLAESGVEEYDENEVMNLFVEEFSDVIDEIFAQE